MTFFPCDDDIDLQKAGEWITKNDIDDLIAYYKSINLQKSEAKRVCINAYLRDFIDPIFLDDPHKEDGMEDYIAEITQKATEYFEERWETWDEWKDQL